MSKIRKLMALAAGIITGGTGIAVSLGATTLFVYGMQVFLYSVRTNSTFVEN